jgi:hypothetical protein
MRARLTYGAALALALAGCGSPEVAAPTASAPARRASYDEHADGREVVATVDGAPIYADCVATQARGLALPEAEARAAALKQCVAFELLARESRRRLPEQPEAVEVQTREAIRALIDREFTPTFDGPEDIPTADLDRFWPKLRGFYNHPELRTIYYCRVRVSKKEPRGGPKDLERKAFAEEVRASLIARKAASQRSLFAACAAAAGKRKLEITKKPLRIGEQDPAYDKTLVDAVFAMKGVVGDVSPPIRTPWGWDVLLLTRIEPPVSKDRVAAEPEIRDLLFYDPEFDGYRVNQFLAWADRIGRGTKVELYPERIPVGDALGVGESAPGEATEPGAAAEPVDDDGERPADAP